MIDENSTKFEDLLMLENISGIYEGHLAEDGDNWSYHAEWFYDELMYYCEKYNIHVHKEGNKSDENIQIIRDDIRDYLLSCLTVVDVEQLGYEIAKDLENEVVNESDIDWRCDNDWLEQIDGVFTHAYDYLKSFGCKIRDYNGKIE